MHFNQLLKTECLSYTIQFKLMVAEKRTWQSQEEKLRTKMPIAISHLTSRLG
jgi:hypothetical protein